MRVMIRYKVKSDQVERNLELARAFFEELEALQPDGLRDMLYQLDDKVSFVQIVDVPQGPAVLYGLPAFQRYRTDLEARCEEPPVMTELHGVGSYRFS